MKENFNALIEHFMESGFFLEQAVEIVEKGMIECALKSTGANQSEASKILGIHRNTLLRKMLEYKIDGKRPRRKPVSRAQSRTVRRPRAAS
jgi:DNA-binding NtrC family response regulator